MLDVVLSPTNPATAAVVGSTVLLLSGHPAGWVFFPLSLVMWFGVEYTTAE